MAYNYGQQLTFTAEATGANLTYVWEWWDGTISVTATNVTTKVANRWGQLAYTVTAVDPWGNKSVRSDTIEVNRPPEILELKADKNDGVFPYQAQVTAKVAGANYPINVQFNGSQGAVAAGTGTFNFDLIVAQAGTKELVATDNAGVISRAQLQFFGRNNLPPAVSAPELTPLVWRTNSKGTVAVVAADPEGGSLTFKWTLSGTNGWTGSAVMENVPGTLHALSYGTKSVLEVDTTGQTPTNPDQFKYIELVVEDPDGGATQFNITTTPIKVVMLPNSNPVIDGMSASPASATVGVPVLFSGTAHDADGDPLSYRWVLSGPINLMTGTVAGTGTVNSRAAIVFTTGTGLITSTFRVFDKYGGEASAAGPQVIVS
jgi:hypothetical protein